ncbi:DUF6597 domain-containing transcriptional factor [Agaribacterium sp. ZY112]|uniref:DUF6597 domain-containing transcriptional factor n=1 Tax=Agaribacterium sp. ZY112 TaxID=3233574 RepID=UPI0035255931
MLSIIQQPHPLLAPYIAQYWSWNLAAGTAIPDLYTGTGLECLFNLGDSIETVLPYAYQIGSGQGLILCPRKRHFSVKTKGKVKLLSIRFRSAGFYRLFGIPLSEFSDKLIDASHIIPNSVFNSLSCAKTQADLSAVLDKFLLQKLKSRPCHDRLTTLIDRIYYHNHLSFKALISDCSLSERSLQRHFKLHTGVSAKYFQRSARFQSCLRSLYRSTQLLKQTEHSQLALAHGYFDQSHFINEVKYFSGQSPKKIIQNKHDGISYYSC